jgi:hypothetical protein
MAPDPGEAESVEQSKASLIASCGAQHTRIRDRSRRNLGAGTRCIKNDMRACADDKRFAHVSRFRFHALSAAQQAFV